MCYFHYSELRQSLFNFITIPPAVGPVFGESEVSLGTVSNGMVVSKRPDIGSEYGCSGFVPPEGIGM